MAYRNFSELNEQLWNGLGIVFSLTLSVGVVMISFTAFTVSRQSLSFDKEFYSGLEGKPVSDSSDVRLGLALKNIYISCAKDINFSENHLLTFLQGCDQKDEFFSSRAQTILGILRGELKNVSDSILIPSWGNILIIIFLMGFGASSLTLTLFFAITRLKSSESMVDWNWKKAWSWAFFLWMLPTLFPFIAIEICVLAPLENRRRAREVREQARQLAQAAQDIRARVTAEHARLLAQCADNARRERERLQREAEVRAREEGHGREDEPLSIEDLLEAETALDFASCMEDAGGYTEDADDDEDALDFASCMEDAGGYTEDAGDEDIQDILNAIDPEEPAQCRQNKEIPDLKTRQREAYSRIAEVKARFEKTKTLWRDFFLKNFCEREKVLEEQTSFARNNLRSWGERLAQAQMEYARKEKLLREYRESASGAKEGKSEAYLREIELILKLEHVAAVEVSGEELHIYTDTLCVEYAGKKYEMGIFFLKILLRSNNIFVRNLASTHPQNHCHVYSTPGDTFCFGNLKETIFSSLKKGEYAVAVEYMIQSLCTLNDEDSYRIFAWKVIGA